MKLVQATNSHFHDIMAWFSNERCLRVWGGPSFRYPFNEHSFIQDLQLDAMRSYCLVNQAGKTIAFGQIYQKLNRGHLARLVVAPEHRRLGYGEELIEQLMKKATQLFSCSEYSLYVTQDNVAARSCYRKFGFVEAATPHKNDPLSSFQFMIYKSR